MAWINAVVVRDGSRTTTRRNDLIINGVDPEVPEAGPLWHVVEALAEVGYAVSSGDGLSQVGWGEIAAWAGITGARMSNSELLAMRKLSGAYVSQHYAAQSPDCPDPSLKIDTTQRKKVENGLKDLFGVLKNG